MPKDAFEAACGGAPINPPLPRGAPPHDAPRRVELLCAVGMKQVQPDREHQRFAQWLLSQQRHQLHQLWPLRRCRGHLAAYKLCPIPLGSCAD